ncbi:MAG TPA: condensation domain-containing protein, partial [Candidatus Kapabacteria bacterium]|nr:condensation domain-containing protein [Candidatus Kapabacteria bacterium]
EQLSLGISGAIELTVFEKTWHTITAANEMLRAVFRWEKLEKPSQVILKKHKCKIVFYDLTDKDSGQREKISAEIKDKDRHDFFNLQHVPFRVILCKLDETQYEMIVSYHHILYDGWSNGIILKEFFRVYHELSKGERLFKLPAKLPFKEFIKWLQKLDSHKQEQSWRNYLAGVETSTVLPIKKKIEKTPGAGDYSVILADHIKSKLDFFVKNNRVTPAPVFYTAWGLLLQRYCGSEDVIFGTTVSGRPGGIKGIEDMVGLFINTIPLRTQTSPNEKIIDVVFRIDQALREREEFENTPLVDIRGYSTVDGSGSLFDSIVVIENYPLDNRLVPGGCLLTVTSYSMNETTHYDLTVGIMLFNEIEIKFSFKRELFEKETIENLAGHFKKIMQTIIEKPETVLSQLEIISAEEKNRILYVFNHTAQEYPANKTIQQLFSGQVEKTPDRIAVVGAAGGEEKRDGMHLSYGELNERSNKLAGLLIEKGTRPDNIVGIMVERFVETVVGIMGILKSGGAYLAIEPQYPSERIDYMLADSNTKIIIGNGHACSE